jgi:hypothetical protein
MLWGLQPIPGEDDGMLFLSCLDEAPFNTLLERLDFTEL